MPVALVQFLGQPSPDLVEHQADERFGPRDVAGWNDEVERRRLLARDQIHDAPVAGARDLGDDGIAVKPEKRHGGAEHARTFVVALVEQLARGRCNHRMHPGFAEMRCRHHRGQRLFDRARRIGQEGRDAGKRLVGLGVEHMQDRADQQRMAGLFPVVAFLQRAFRVDQHVGHVLHVADLPLAAPHLQQRVVGVRRRVGRVEQQDAAMLRAEAGGQRPVLAFDVVDDRRRRPGQERGHHQADALAAAGRRVAQHMLGTVMA